MALVDAHLVAAMRRAVTIDRVAFELTPYRDLRTTEITAIGASSWMRTDQGASNASLSRNAPRARGPSSSPAMASMALDDRTWMSASQLWIV